MIPLYNIPDIQTLLPNHIGKLLAYKWDNYVYEYGNEQVIKFSKFFFFMWVKNAYKKAEFDLSTTKKYFWDYMLDTEIISLLQVSKIALVQQKIIGRKMHISDMNNAFLKKQFIDLMNRYEKLKQETAFDLDLIGGESRLWEYMGNIFVIDEKKLLIIDVTLLSTKWFRYMRPLIYILFSIAKYLQEKRITLFMNVS